MSSEPRLSAPQQYRPGVHPAGSRRQAEQSHHAHGQLDRQLGVYRMALSPTEQARLDNVFSYHAPKGDQASRYELIRAFAKRLAEEIMALTPGSREQSLALTNLEQAVMWANAAIARNE